MTNKTNYFQTIYVKKNEKVNHAIKSIHNKSEILQKANL